MQVNKVAGNFHFAPGRSYQQGSMHVHDIAPFGDAVMDFSHTITQLSFGKPYPGMKNPLDSVKVTQSVGANKPSGMYQYFLKVRACMRGDTPPPYMHGGGCNACGCAAPTSIDLLRKTLTRGFGNCCPPHST